MLFSFSNFTFSRLDFLLLYQKRDREVDNILKFKNKGHKNKFNYFIDLGLSNYFKIKIKWLLTNYFIYSYSKILKRFVKYNFVK